MAEAIEKQPAVYRFGQFEVDAREQLLRRNGEIVPLTPKIFEILLLLIKNNGRMLSKDEIMQAIWADSFVEETNLTSNISRLRKILHDVGEQFIETYPKRGYRFRAEVETASGETEVIVTRRITAHIRQIIEDDEEDAIAPEYLARLATVPNNLSIPPTALVGREREINEIENLLRKSRLVTLTGIGGTGKTRLAQEIAVRMLAEFAGGAFFVALDAVRSSELLAPAIAQALGIRDAGGKTLVEMLKDFLREKPILLVADNFEQIVSAAPFLGEILAAAPDLKILVTSRALLGIKPEREFRVPPLALPENIREATAENLSGYESVKLFLARAAAAKPNFTAAEENLRTIAEICRRLDGLPLAIELAAARIKILSPAQILERLENRLKILTGGARDLPARQQTMRGAIAWSFDLLDENERILFRRLAVFAGGLTIEAAEEVSGELEEVSGEQRAVSSKEKVEDKEAVVDKNEIAETGQLLTAHRSPLTVLDGVISLVENSLLVQTELANGESRFRLLEVVREYALEILEASGEGEVMRKNHAAFFLALAERAYAEFYGERESEWLNRLEDEHDNIRAALSWSIVNHTETAVNLAVVLRRLWLLHNHLTEGRRWLEKVLEKASDISDESRMKLCFGLGQAAHYQGDNETAWKMFEESLALGKAAGDKRQIALSNRGLGAVAKQQGDIKTAKKFMAEGLKISRELQDALGIAVSLNNLGDLARLEDDYAAARPLLEESLAISKQLGNAQGICGTSNNLGAVIFGEGDYETARAHFAKAVELAQKLGDKVGVSYSLDGFAALAARNKDFAQAARLAGAAEHLRESLGFETEPAERRFRGAYLGELHSALDEETFSEAYRQGKELKIETAVELALNKPQN